MLLQSLVQVILVLAGLLLLPVAGNPLLDHTVENLRPQRMVEPRQAQASTVAITGITGFGIQPRIEIRQMEEDVDLFNIYILGLVHMMAVNQTDELSYYQIAGESNVIFT